jgi:hypothetical protein
MKLSDTQLIKKVDDRLNLLHQHDDDFQAEFQQIQLYYLHKFEYIINENDVKVFRSWLRKSMIEQFQNGYTMIEQYYNDETAYIEEALFTLPEGMFTENTPHILREILEPLLEQGILFDEIIDTDTTHDLIIWSMERYENLRPMLKQTSFDLTCLGARQALRDKRKELEIEPVELDTEERKLGNIGDLQFINPQMYLTINHISQNVEYWDIHYWSSNLNGTEKIGEVLVLTEPNFVETKIKVSYHLSMLASINDEDIQAVAEYHINKLTDYAERDEIQYHLTLVTDFFTQV